MSTLRLLLSSRLPVTALSTKLPKRGFATEQLKKTVLYDYHVKNGGKMVPFAGYLMPVQYTSLSIIASHHHTREKCSIFDVSHMLQSEVHGKDKFHFMEKLVTGDIGLLRPGHGTLTLFTNENGGIIDDLIVSSTDEGHLYVVSNAGCRDKDIRLMSSMEHYLNTQGKDISLKLREDLSLLAVQGPTAAAVVQELTKIDLSKLYFMNTKYGSIAGIDGCRITRCGYTGEDGVEISVPSDKATVLADALMSSKVSDVQLAGLGARDTLRLEAGLCLYGNDMDENTTPPEAGLTWLIGKTRKERRDFPGAKQILEQLQTKNLRKRRIGLVSTEGPPPRSHMSIVDSNSKKIGEITSGCCLKTGYNIAMAYVEGNPALGTELDIQVRNLTVKGKVTKMPFLKGKYYMPPKQ